VAATRRDPGDLPPHLPVADERESHVVLSVLSPIAAANRIIGFDPGIEQKNVSTPSAGPRCPRCRRPLAAWRLDHCIYCGESLPAELKEGFQAPEALKWIERPELPADVSKKLAMMKLVPSSDVKRPQSWVRTAGFVSLPIFAVIFYLLYRVIRQVSPTFAFLLILIGFAVIGYLLWFFWRVGKE
jgi:hypothetical protein